MLTEVEPIGDSLSCKMGVIGTMSFKGLPFMTYSGQRLPTD